MRNKTTRALVASCLLSFLSFSSSLNADDGFEVNKFSSIQKFYYNLGRNRSKEEFYRKGYADAVRDFNSLLKKYEEKIKKIEAGKYLIEAGKITYPEIYKTRNSEGGYQIHIDAPVVEREFTAQDLFIVPLVNGGGNSTKRISYPNEIKNNSDDSVSDKFFIPSMSNEVTSVPSKPKDITHKVYIDIRYKSSKIKEFLDAYNAKYASSDNGYKVEFNNEAEKRRFCIDLTGEASCYGLN